MKKHRYKMKINVCLFALSVFIFGFLIYGCSSSGDGDSAEDDSSLYGSNSRGDVALGEDDSSPRVDAFSQVLLDYWADLYEDCPRELNPTLEIDLIAKAESDECFYDVGDPRNRYLAKTCDDGSWKVNESMVWALAKSGNKLWFGTLANSRCAAGGDPILGGTGDPILSDLYVCEFGEGPWQGHLVPYGDWRPPSVYVYNLETRELAKKARLVPGTMGGLPVIQGTRGAGSLGSIVFLGGGSGRIDTRSESVTLLAYNSETEEFLGWHKLKDSMGENYLNIRKWLTYKGNLYVCVWQDRGGHILRWLGDPKAIQRGDLTTLWDFEEVGNIDSGGPANITVYDGRRLAVSTWPIGPQSGCQGGQIWLSPEFDDHLTAADAGSWEKVWSVKDYDPDKMTTCTAGLGDLHYFDGYLWWGTMHVPGVAWNYHKAIYSTAIEGYPDEEEEIAAFYGTWRPTSVFRGRNLGTPDQEIDIVYGFSSLPKFAYNPKNKAWEWHIVPNKMGGQAPLWGPGGFCNWYQFYTFTMALHNEQLLIGTNQISLRFAQEDVWIPMPVPSDESLWGGELWRFPNAQSPAIAENLSGLGNYTNTNIRNMVVSEDTLYVGATNPHNLLTDPDDGLPEGGWELLELNLDHPRIVDPLPGSTLKDTTITFQWIDSGLPVIEWRLDVGTDTGKQDVYDSGSLGTGTSAVVSGLPHDGSQLYVRLWFRTGVVWEYADFKYTAAIQSNGGGGVVVYKEGAMDGYTLIGAVSSFRASPVVALIDMEGQIVQTWDLTGIPVKMLPGGQVMARTSLLQTSHLIQRDWFGKSVWSVPIYMDHDFQRQGNPVGHYAPGQDFVEKGKTLILTLEEYSVPEISSKPLTDGVIYEVNWDGSHTDFKWRGVDGYDQYGFDQSAMDAIYSRGGDWLHLNAVSLVGQNRWWDETGDERFNPENIIIGSRHANFVIIISRQTGEVVWRIGPEFSQGTPEHGLGQLMGPHHAHIIPKGLPGEGNMLVFDNGAHSGYGGSRGYPKYLRRRYSRILEFNPVTLEKVWEYKGNLLEDNRFKSEWRGSAQRLPNGNTLICSSEEGRVFEVTPQKEVVWDYRIYIDGNSMTSYRAYRVPPEWLPKGVNPGGYQYWDDVVITE